MKFKNCKIGMKVRVKRLEQVQDKWWWTACDNEHCGRLGTITDVETRNDGLPVCVMFDETMGDDFTWLNPKAIKKAHPKFIKIIKSPNQTEFVEGETKKVYRGYFSLLGLKVKVNYVITNKGDKLYNLSFLENGKVRYDEHVDAEGCWLEGLKVEALFDQLGI